ncbi:MAG: YgjV family protein [Clostridia bacterium]|nr:YgjV family protein [Clostridia bacterium]
MRILSHIFGIGAMTALFLSYQQKSRKNLIIAKLITDISWVAHYFFLGATAGMIPNFVGIFREVVFINRNSKKWASSVFWPILFIMINWSLGIISFKSWFDILPITASSFVTVSLWLNNPRLTKLISIPVSCAFLVYDIFVSSYIGIITESIAILSIIIFFIKNKGVHNNGK